MSQSDRWRKGPEVSLSPARLAIEHWNQSLYVGDKAQHLSIDRPYMFNPGYCRQTQKNSFHLLGLVHIRKQDNSKGWWWTGKAGSAGMGQRCLREHNLASMGGGERDHTHCGRGRPKGASGSLLVGEREENRKNEIWHLQTIPGGECCPHTSTQISQRHITDILQWGKEWGRGTKKRKSNNKNKLGWDLKERKETCLAGCWHRSKPQFPMWPRVSPKWFLSRARNSLRALLCMDLKPKTKQNKNLGPGGAFTLRTTKPGSIS